MVEVEPGIWLPRLEQELRALGAFQLEGMRRVQSQQLQVKEDANGERSVVTAYDTESEARIRQFLHQSFPQHSFLGEETGNHTRDPESYWILDPIDGTTNFVHGLPFWGPSLAYWHRGVPQLAWIYFPALDNMFTAWRGGGTWLNGRRIHGNANREYTMLTTVALHSRTHFQHRLRLRAKVRVLGSLIGNMCYTALGTFSAMHGRGRLWDLAAGLLILDEAGARVETDPPLQTLDLPAYAQDEDAGQVMTLYAQTNEHLPPLRDYLEPSNPLSTP